MDKNEILGKLSNYGSIFDLQFYSGEFFSDEKYKEEVSKISKQELRGVVEQVALNEANRLMPIVVRRQEDPEYCMVNEWSLAYAIKKGKFSETEVKKIKFDHHNNLEQFLRIDTEKAIDRVTEGILNPPKREKLTTIDYVDLCCCDCPTYW